MAKTVIILGASFAGIKIAHALLKNTVPAVKDLKVYLVSPTTHAYFNLASPRAIVPGQIPDEKILAPIEPAFSKYSQTNFEFVIGTATSIDPTGKKVEIETESGSRNMTYDALVVTTGSSTGSMPWKATGSYKQTLEALHAVQEKVKNAKSIVVGGAGVTGVETAGELGFEYGKTKKITLISKDAVILGNFLAPKVGTSALKELQVRNVNVEFNKRVVSDSVLPSGQTELTLSTGEKLLCDLYLPCFGVTPNTTFMPASLLNTHHEIVVDEFMAVKGVEDVWSCGDAAAIEGKRVMAAGEQAAWLAAALNTVLTTGKKPAAPYKVNSKVMGALTVGRAKGFGQMGSWSLPSFLVMFVKGKTMMVEKLPAALNGAM